MHIFYFLLPFDCSYYYLMLHNPLGHESHSGAVFKDNATNLRCLGSCEFNFQNFDSDASLQIIVSAGSS